MDTIQKVRDDFAFLKEKYFAVLVFGSHAKGYSVPNSDIDVCIVTKEPRRAVSCYHEIYPHVRMDLYDVVIFEHCDDDLKSEIARDHLVVYSEHSEELERYLTAYKSRAIRLRTLHEIAVDLGAVVDALCAEALRGSEHDPKVTPEEGIKRVGEGMKRIYQSTCMMELLLKSSKHQKGGDGNGSGSSAG